MNDTRPRDTARLATTVGGIAIGSAACLGAFFAVGGPFGSINDIGNATVGVLSATLAWRLRRHIPGRAGHLAVGGAALGAAITVVGSALVVSGSTGWFLAGLVSSVGFAGIGACLVVLNRSSAGADAWPPRLRSLGVLAGGLMALGVVAVPGILLRLDDVATAPGWVWIALLGWLGIFPVYPAWAVWLGIIESRRARRELASGLGGHWTDGEEARSWTRG